MSGLPRAIPPDAHHLELTPFRSKDGLAAANSDEFHITRDREYGVQQRKRGCMHYLQHQGQHKPLIGPESPESPTGQAQQQQQPGKMGSLVLGWLLRPPPQMHTWLPVAHMGPSRPGGWLLATAHIVTAIIGAGVLGLPYALSWLGWVGGIITLLVFYAITLWASLLLTECHETGGMKHPTYRSAVLHVLGPGNAVILSTFQYLNLILSSIGYTVAAGQSLRIIVGEVCSRSRFETCYNSVWQMSLAFGGCQLLLSQMPNLESAWWSSIIGAAMSFMYSSCALGLGASKAHNRYGSLTGRAAPPGQPWVKAFNIFNALGSVAFAYNFTGVLMEIQDTLHEPPKAVVNMKRAVNTGMGCSLMFYLAVSITGYMALGDKVPGDILTGFSEPAGVVGAANVMVLLHMLPAYQVFSQPVFHGLEMAITDHVPGASRVPTLALRIVVRSLYVCFTTTVAVLMPFFTDIIGLVGALVFWPAAVYYPVRLYCKLYKPRRTVLTLMQIMNVVAALTSLLAVVGASWNIKQHVGQFTFSWLQQGHSG